MNSSSDPRLMRYLVFFLILSVSVTLFGNVAYGLWMPQSVEDLFDQSETIFVGTIKSVDILEFERSNVYEIEKNGQLQKIVENYTQTLDQYTVDVEAFLKNPLDSPTISLLEATVSGVPGRSVSIGGFEIGDRVLFYIPNLDGENQYSPESFKIPEQCDTKSVLEKSRVIGVNNFTTIQNGIPIKNNFTANLPIEFVFDKDMKTLDGSWFEVNFRISKIYENNRQTIFEDTIRGESLPCEWIATAKWNVILDGEGKYRIDMNDVGDLSVNTSSWRINVIEDSKARIFSGSLNPDPVTDLWSKHAEIIDGTIVSKTIHPDTRDGSTGFHVKINKFFKPLSKNTESITLFADSDTASLFEEGDRALVYIEPGNRISGYSVSVDESTYCEPRDYIQIAPVLPNDPNQLVRGPPTLSFDWKDQCVPDYFDSDPNFWLYREYKSPMQQWKVHNLPIENQKCRIGEDYVSVQKTGNSNYVYCIKSESIPKLVERGWMDSVAR